MLNLDPNRKLRNLKLLPEVQEFRSLTRKSRNPGFLPGNSGIQDSWQEIQDFPGSQTLGAYDENYLTMLVTE